MSTGDVVLAPHKHSFYVGAVAGKPTHNSEDPIGEVFRRPVYWLNAGRAFSKVDYPDVARALLERKTCYEINLVLRPEVGAFAQGLVKQDSIAFDIAQVNARALKETTRTALIAARIGQGDYRSDVLERWGNACAVTGCSILEAVRASHAVPWSLSNDHERLDSNNGLPLLANLDALFDVGLIAFDEAGQMLVSPRVPATSYQLLGIPAKLRAVPSEAQAAYLSRHRELKFAPKSII